jgi:hypothetical protein
MQYRASVLNRVLALSLACALPCLVSPAWAQSAESKAKLVDKLLTLWHPEEVAIVMVQRPASNALQQARIALQGRVSPQKQEATLKDIATDVQKYIDEATPIARDGGKKAVSTVVAPMLMQQFTEDELKQMIAILESPVKKKFEQLMPQMEKALGEKVSADNAALIDPKLKTMTQAVGMKLRTATVTP